MSHQAQHPQQGGSPRGGARRVPRAAGAAQDLLPGTPKETPVVPLPDGLRGQRKRRCCVPPSPVGCLQVLESLCRAPGRPPGGEHSVPSPSRGPWPAVGAATSCSPGPRSAVSDLGRLPPLVLPATDRHPTSCPLPSVSTVRWFLGFFFLGFIYLFMRDTERR